MQAVTNNNEHGKESLLGLQGVNNAMLAGRYSPTYRVTESVRRGGQSQLFSAGYDDGHGALFRHDNTHTLMTSRSDNAHSLMTSRTDNTPRVDTSHALTELTSPIKTSPSSAAGLLQKQDAAAYAQSPMHHQDLQTGQQLVNASRHQMPLHAFGAPPGGDAMLDSMGAAMPVLTSMSEACHASAGLQTGGHHMYSHSMYSHGMSGVGCQSGGMGAMATGLSHPGLTAPHPGLPMSGAAHPALQQQEMDCDPRELEAFAERFKQRRIKLGVTQADVGNALGKLKLPGVGSLSQSTICRFESLTLSHNNMIALKPILIAWLEEAEQRMREKGEAEGVTEIDKKRKRTSIAAPEKRSLEAYFSVQPRPSGEKIAQIAEKLDLKKSVVRVWFCNQRQKQKRLKFSALPPGSAMSPGPHGHSPNGTHH